MAKQNSLKIFHRALNFLILVLCVVVFALMIRLIRTEYFSSNNKKETDLDLSDLNCNCKCNCTEEEELDLNNQNSKNNNQIDKLFEIIIPDDSPESININNSYETNAVLENGLIKIPKPTFVGENNNVAKINDNRVTEMVALNNTYTENSNNEDSFEKKSMINKVRNFLEFPDMQKYCPSIDNSESSFWAQMPEDYAGDIHVKFCCTSCFYFISEEIYCGENENGKYKLENLSVTDINLLKELYQQTPEMNEKYAFPEVKLGSLLGKPVLKYKYNNEYYTIQVAKSLQDLSLHEAEPTILKDLYKRHYQCPAIATKPVLQILNF
jgi:hypothetical protein